MKNLLLFMAYFFFILIDGYGQVNKKSILEDPKAFNQILKTSAWGKKIFIGKSAKGTPIYGYYFNRGGTDNAMVLGGVHGSEFYGSDLADSLVSILKKHKRGPFKWRTLIIPELFVDNVKYGREDIFEIGRGRITCKGCSDPNQQMPELGKGFNIKDSLSFKNEIIEIENRYLLHITQAFNPSRIVSLHCKNGRSNWLSDDIEDNEVQIGIYVDPKTDQNNIALGFTEDALLALKMAFVVKENGGIIHGNFIDSNYMKVQHKFEVSPKIQFLNPVYPKDPPFTFRGTEQRRSYKEENKGITFGTWASTEIKENNIIIKKAASIYTIELPQYYSFFEKKDDLTSLKKDELMKNTGAYLKALKEVFLEIK